MQSIRELIPRKKIHFVGIGGVGMSALAQILLARGYSVAGSDVQESKITHRLRSFGAVVFIGHKSSNIGDVDAVVYSSCIKNDNCEIKTARKKKIKIFHRALLLSIIMQEKCSIAVAGTHGKTTTTSLIALLLKLNQSKPGFAIGADVDVLGGNAAYGTGRYFVAEADESDGSLKSLHPVYAVVTNIDRDHLDYYRNLSHIIKAFNIFLRNIKKSGALFYCAEDKNIKTALKGYRGRRISYGFKPGAQIRASRVSSQGMSCEFDCFYKNKLFGKFKLSIPGEHNILNALACIAVGIELGIDKKIIYKTLKLFKGAERRFQIKNKNNGILIIDDYAHHPTEITATLRAARSWKNKRVVGVFQPHRYSRTKLLKKEFGRCFAYADHVVITDIYAAHEAPIKGVAAKTIYKQIKQSGHKSVCLLPRSKIKDYIRTTLKSGDMLMLLGAGDIGKLAEELSLVLSKEKAKTKK